MKVEQFSELKNGKSQEMENVLGNVEIIKQKFEG
jgi:hypothetical protein